MSSTISRRTLSQKPLVEAIFEMRWEIEGVPQDAGPDPNFPIFAGSLFSHLSDEYRFIERLSTSVMPPVLAGHVVQFRFRKSDGGWPLVQAGPGVITLNDTDSYSWPDFRPRINRLAKAVFDVHPSSTDLKPTKLELRYIDAVEVSLGTERLLDFLQSQMKTEVRLPPSLFEETCVDSAPMSLDLRFAYPCKKPDGCVHLRFVKGQKQGVDALIWETVVQCINDVPRQLDVIQQWIDDAHVLTDDWFFKMIAGELEERFK